MRNLCDFISRFVIAILVAISVDWVYIPTTIAAPAAPAPTATGPISEDDFKRALRNAVRDISNLESLWADVETIGRRPVYLTGGILRGVMRELKREGARNVLNLDHPLEPKLSHEYLILQNSDQDLVAPESLKDRVNSHFPRPWDVLDSEFVKDSERVGGGTLEKVLVNPWEIVDPYGAIHDYLNDRHVFVLPENGPAQGKIFGNTRLAMALRFLRMSYNLPEAKITDESWKRLRTISGLEANVIKRGTTHDYWIMKSLMKLYSSTPDWREFVESLRRANLLLLLTKHFYSLAPEATKLPSPATLASVTANMSLEERIAIAQIMGRNIEERVGYLDAIRSDVIETGGFAKSIESAMERQRGLEGKFGAVNEVKGAGLRLLDGEAMAVNYPHLAIVLQYPDGQIPFLFKRGDWKSIRQLLNLHASTGIDSLLVRQLYAYPYDGEGRQVQLETLQRIEKYAHGTRIALEESMQANPWMKELIRPLIETGDKRTQELVAIYMFKPEYTADMRAEIELLIDAGNAGANRYLLIQTFSQEHHADKASLVMKILNAADKEMIDTFLMKTSYAWKDHPEIVRFAMRRGLQFGLWDEVAKALAWVKNPAEFRDFAIRVCQSGDNFALRSFTRDAMREGRFVDQPDVLKAFLENAYEYHLEDFKRNFSVASVRAKGGEYVQLAEAMAINDLAERKRFIRHPGHPHLNCPSLFK